MAFWEGSRKYIFGFLSCILMAVWTCGAEIHYCTEMLSDGATDGAGLVLENKENSLW